MKTVSFWEAMKARTEGKAIRRVHADDTPGAVWIKAETMRNWYVEDEQCQWQIKSEPRGFTIAVFADGRMTAHEADSLIVEYKGSPPTHTIRVREIIED